MEQKLNLVLLVDDDASTNLLTKKMIENTGLVEEVAVATSGAAALNFLRKQLEMGLNLPEITFLDLNMPEMTGWDFLDEFKQIFGDASNHEVVLLTASSSTNDLIKSAVHPSVEKYINKPITDFEVKHALEDHLRNKVAVM